MNYCRLNKKCSSKKQRQVIEIYLIHKIHAQKSLSTAMGRKGDGSVREQRSAPKETLGLSKNRPQREQNRPLCEKSTTFMPVIKN